MTYTIGQIAQLLNASIDGETSLIITGAAKIDEAAVGTISFITNPKYASAIYDTKASAVLVSKSLELTQAIPATLVRVDDVNISMQKLLGLFAITYERGSGISEQSSIAPTCQIGNGVSVGDFSVIEDNSHIGDGTIIYPQVYIGKDVIVGKNCKLYAGVRVQDRCIIGDNVIIHPNAVIGSDGFGFVPDASGAFQKVVQAGNVIIEDDVEIGSNTVIDRATLGSTIIRRGVKLDNLIQIAHNVEIKKHTVISAQAGIAGSTVVGAHSQIGGQVGIVGHLNLADGIKVQAQSGIASPIEEKNTKWYGSPAIKYFNYLRSFAIFKKLPELQKEINELKNQISKLRDEREGQDI